ncbi:MAG: TsoY family (seleno)protein [Campylobacterales bacterium]
MKMINNLGEKYSPFYYLASLGAGGMSVSFFIYLMFMIPHPDTPLVTFNHIFPYITEMNFISLLIVIDILVIIYFAFLHFRILLWNIKEYKAFKQTEAFMALKTSNAEVSLMAIPLTYAMTINVLFVLGAVFVPGLWSVVEYMFPLALLGFLAVGIYALKIFGDYFVRIIINGDFDFVSNNNLSQMISIFAFSMIAVGFAAPGAMSHYMAVSAFGLFCSMFFAVIAASLALVKIILGIKSILKQGISKEASVSLWIMIPILTLLGITGVRMTFGFSHGFTNEEPSTAWLFILTSAILSLQLMFGYVGYLVMKRVGYFKHYINGDEKKPSSFAIVCPGVAFFVFGMFFIFFGLVQTGVLPKFSIIYFILLAPFTYVQIKTALVILKLNKKLLKA